MVITRGQNIMLELQPTCQCLPSFWINFPRNMHVSLSDRAGLQEGLEGLGTPSALNLNSVANPDRGGLLQLTRQPSTGD